ncbi:MAG: hypothetical protein ACP5VR_05330 [Acidimicrobiales bacterium]
MATERLVGERFSMKCPNCQTKELVVIEMVVGGQRVTLRSCSACDLRWWETAEGTASLADVLDLAAVAH